MIVATLGCEVLLVGVRYLSRESPLHGIYWGMSLTREPLLSIGFGVRRREKNGNHAGT